MNLPTILISLVIATLFVLAIRYLRRNGMCAACEDKGACQAAKKANGAANSSGCSGKCASCQHHDYELKSSPVKLQIGK